ncbi:MAG TPA: DUF2189 domain-containing protein [Xanthobacteraceae bacterium]|nr:DUF2189 domain-containing protein [Xanthobacteraceae bacterium]
MAYQDFATKARPAAPLPTIRRIEIGDLMEALRRGMDDFRAMPTTHVVFLSLIYPLVGLVLARLTFGYDVVPLLYPVVAGFALIGPFAAVWMYEMSRRREAGLDVSWRHAFDVLHARSFGAILALGLLLTVIFVVWLAVANTIYTAIMGYGAPVSFELFMRRVLTTPEGWLLIAVGNAVGLLFAATVLTISVVSFPLLLDRHVGPITAMATSAKAVAKNPGPMAVWGLVVAAALVAGSIPFLFGLAVVMPILGHATWHLYRKVVDARALAPQEYREPRKPRRYAAEFPAALFPVSGEPRS